MLHHAVKPSFLFHFSIKKFIYVCSTLIQPYIDKLGNPYVNQLHVYYIKFKGGFFLLLLFFCCNSPVVVSLLLLLFRDMNKLPHPLQFSCCYFFVVVFFRDMNKLLPPASTPIHTSLHCCLVLLLLLFFFFFFFL